MLPFHLGASQFVYTHFSSANGLSSNHIHDITQDKNGFIWIASHYGVSRFNGSSFHNYLAADYPSMFRNDMYHSFLMKDGTVAFGSSKGVLVAYNDKLDSFSDFTPSDSFYHDITGYAQCFDGEELISTSAGIYCFSPQQQQFQFLPVLPKGTYAFEVYKDQFQHFWVGTNNGVYVLNRNGEKVAGFDALTAVRDRINNICLFNNNCLLLCSTTGAVWMATIGNNGGLVKLNMVNTPFKNISEVCPDGSSVWFGTSGAGLWRADYKNGTFSFERCMPVNRDDSDVRKISALFKDVDGNIWVGTQNTGLWRITPVLKSDVAFSNNLGIPVVTGSSFYENDRHEILLGTDGQGLYVLDSLFNVRRHFTENDGLSSNNVLSLKKYGSQCLVSYWAGAVSVMNPVSFQCAKMPFVGIDAPMYTAKYADVDAEGNIYVCTSGDGVYVGNRNRWSRLSLPHVPGVLAAAPDLWTSHICFSPDGTAWLTTTRTVWRIGAKGDKVPVLPDTEGSATHNPVELHQAVTDGKGNCFVAASNGIYWLAADGSGYQKLDFLPVGAYCSILLGDDGRFWTAGTNGILSFSFEQKNYTVEVDGLDGYDQDFFIPRAVFKDSRNRLFFGSKQGFVMLNPMENTMVAQPFVVWSDFYLKGVRVKPGEADFLPSALAYTDQLNLAYNQTDFALKFDVVNFSERNAVAAFYRISNIDTTWVPVGIDNTIGFTQLQPGEYDLQVTFRTRGLLLDGVTLNKHIVVSPPWWRTWWFYTLLLVAVVAVVLLYFFNRIRNITLQKQELEQKVTERTQELRDANLSLQQREREVELQNDMLNSALKDKDQLVSIVAHDLKNPMFSIVGSLEDMLRDDAQKDNEMLRQIYRASSVLQGQMLKLLDWATEQRLTTSCDFQDIDLKELVAEVTALLQGIIHDKGINLSVNVSVKHYVYADPRMLSTIIRNLLNNALKFTSQGKSVFLSAVEDGDMVRLVVRDEGVGMTADTVEKLKNGSRVSHLGTASEKGYGLGFGIIQDFVKQNNGTLTIESEVGRGSEISVSLVRSDKLLQKSATVAAVEPKSSIVVDRDLLEGKTILVVDDDPLILLHLKTLLGKYVNVLMAKNGEEGLQLAKNSIPDLILSDVEMPKMDGMDMFDALRKNSLTSNIPFLFLSAINAEAFRLRGLAGGAIDYITKPFNESELLLKVCNVLSVLKKQQLAILMGAMNGEDQKSADVNPLLDQLLDVVKEHYSEPGYSFDDMAAALGLSKSTLVRRLKSLTDKSPVEILSDYRLNKARQLLLSGNASVSDVAYAVGFNDPLYFSRKFKEAFGCPPSKVK